MRADKRKTGLLMLLPHIRYEPRICSVASLALIAKFGFMDVEMTGRASNVLRSEYELLMA
jgi:hypothetical protein